jgi:tetratricopeptide (TPR) repeat protein
VPVAERLAHLEFHRDLVDQRDDLSVELASLYNSTSQPERALALLLSREFQPWEGGEGVVLAQYVRANMLLGQRALQAGEPADALRLFEAAQNPPENIGEAPHLLSNRSLVDYWLGVSCAKNGNAARAAMYFERAASTQGDFQDMQVKVVSEMTFWSAMALEHVSRRQEAQALLDRILSFADALETKTAKIDYFATSLPAMLLFEEDLQQRQTITARFLRAQAMFGFGEIEAGSRLLREVLQFDPGHTGAIDFMQTELPR